MKYPRITFSIVIFIFIASLVVTSLSYMNWDASWLIRCAERMLDGGHYYTDFFETNPPLIIWFSMPIVLISKSTHIAIPIVFRIYLYFFCIVMLGSAFYFCRRLFAKTGFADIAFISVAFIYFLIAAVMFGEREHICIIFITPYLFLRCLSLEKKTTNKILRIVVAVFASIGFLIKPYFLLPFVLFEFYLLYRKKKFSSLFNLEPVVVAVITLLYLFLIFQLTPNYIYKVVPLTVTLYSAVWKDTVLHLLQFNSAIAWLFASLILPWFIRNHPYKNTLLGLWVILLGFWFVYFWQHKAWYYHVYPAISIATIIIAICLVEKFNVLRGDKFQLGLHFINSLELIILTLFVVACLFSTTVRLNAVSIYLGQSHKSIYRSLISIPKMYQYQGPILVLTVNIGQSELLYRYAHAEPVLLTPSLFLVAGVRMLDEQKKALSPWQQHAVTQAWDLFNQQLYTVKPKIVIDQKKTGFLKFLRKNKQFNEYFSHFKLAGKHGVYKIYRYDS